MKLDTKSLKIRLWLYFILFTSLILVLIWLLQIVLLQSTYEGMKESEMKKLAAQIGEAIPGGEVAGRINELSFKNSLLVYVFDADGAVLYTSEDQPGFGRPHRPGLKNAPQFIQQIEASTDKTYLQKSDTPEFKSMTLTLGAKIETEDNKTYYLYIASPLDPVNSTTSILQRQLFYVTIGTLLLGFGIAFFIARKLSRPISNISNTAKKLAVGNYAVHFEGGDYSEIDELAQTLNYTAQELNKVETLRRELVANVSHDLRTPLTMIKAYGEMIRDLSGDNPEKRSAHLQVIIDEADRLTALVSDLLDLSKIQAGNIELTLTECNLSVLVKGVIKSFQWLSEQQGYRFLQEIEADIIVEVDEVRMAQVIYNFIGNAVNYTGDDKQIHITLAKQDGQAYFAVTDTGKGIPREQKAWIWERYYKSSETHKRAVVGTGLGLSIVRDVLNRLNATYGVESEVGNGSTFWFRLKLR